MVILFCSAKRKRSALWSEGAASCCAAVAAGRARRWSAKRGGGSTNSYGVTGVMGVIGVIGVNGVPGVMHVDGTVGEMGDAGGGARGLKAVVEVGAATVLALGEGELGVSMPGAMLTTTAPRGAWLLMRCVTSLEKKRSTVCYDGA